MSRRQVIGIDFNADLVVGGAADIVPADGEVQFDGSARLKGSLKSIWASPTPAQEKNNGTSDEPKRNEHSAAAGHAVLREAQNGLEQDTQLPARKFRKRQPILKTTRGLGYEQVKRSGDGLDHYRQASENFPIGLGVDHRRSVALSAMRHAPDPRRVD